MALNALLGGGNVKSLETQDDGVETLTTEEQKKVEQTVLSNYLQYQSYMDLDARIQLNREKHLSYLKKGLHHLSCSYECLDASRPWLCYWILHSLELLDEPIPEETAIKIAEFLGKCQHKDGGFAGGPGQVPHLAPTYASVNALCILGRHCKGAYEVIDRQGLQRFLLSRHNKDGAFTMHEDGEVDIRGAYCAVVASRLTNVHTKEMFENTAAWLKTCQTFEGGFSGAPGLEAHGGYTFCGFAALALLGQENRANIKLLLRWVVNRQMKLEGGFQGRTNKLVDGCYSFWQGGLFPILHSILQMYDDESIPKDSWMFDQAALQEYILLNCQSTAGGLVDKPGKSRDFYHTCYCLSGLSVAQTFIGDECRETNIVGGKHNLLKLTHPTYNIGVDSAFDALEYFSNKPTSF